MKCRGIFEYEYPVEHKEPVEIDVYLHGDCVKGKIIEWEYKALEPTIKNDLGVDCISREQALNEFCIYNSYDSIGVDKVRSYLKALPSVTPQEPIHGKCNQCKHYEGVHNVQGHAPCSYHKIGGVLWNWYCSQFESEDKE